jgi:hypothetical protein
MILEERGLFKYIIAGLFVMPVFTVVNLQTALLIAPACFLGIFMAWYRPHKVILISPKHLADAIEELDPLNEDMLIQVYNKSAEDYAKYVDDDFPRL